MNSIIKMSNQDIKDSKLKNKFNNLVQTDKGELYDIKIKEVA